jgi:hypothetical protein
MMNIVEVQNALKSVPTEKLESYIKEPSPQVPSFLALAEISRRKNAMKDKRAPTTTVAQDMLGQGMQPHAGLIGRQGPPPKKTPSGQPMRPPPPQSPNRGFAQGGIIGYANGGDVQSRLSRMPIKTLTNMMGSPERYGFTTQDIEDELLRRKRGPAPAGIPMPDAGIGNSTRNAPQRMGIAPREGTGYDTTPAFANPIVPQPIPSGIAARSAARAEQFGVPSVDPRLGHVAPGTPYTPGVAPSRKEYGDSDLAFDQMRKREKQKRALALEADHPDEPWFGWNVNPPSAVDPQIAPKQLLTPKPEQKKFIGDPSLGITGEPPPFDGGDPDLPPGMVDPTVLVPNPQPRHFDPGSLPASMWAEPSAGGVGDLQKKYTGGKSNKAEREAWLKSSEKNKKKVETSLFNQGVPTEAAKLLKEQMAQARKDKKSDAWLRLAEFGAKLAASGHPNLGVAAGRAAASTIPGMAADNATARKAQAENIRTMATIEQQGNQNQIARQRNALLEQQIKQDPAKFRTLDLISKRLGIGLDDAILLHNRDPEKRKYYDEKIMLERINGAEKAISDIPPTLIGEAREAEKQRIIRAYFGAKTPKASKGPPMVKDPDNPGGYRYTGK